MGDEYARINTKADFIRRTDSLNSNTRIFVGWDYPKETLSAQTEAIISSSYIIGGDKPTEFELEIQNPLQTEAIRECIKPCLEWMMSHDAGKDDTVKWKFWQLAKMAGLKEIK
jgi:hypothetical protein